MGFFRVRVRETTDYFVIVQAKNAIKASEFALAFKTAPKPNVLGSAKVNSSFPVYSEVNNVNIGDPTNEFSKLYAKNIANEAQQNLDKIVDDLNSVVTFSEFYLLQENITTLSDTIEVILA